MMSDRVFTDEELQEMGARTVDLIDQAIEAGETEKAKKLSRRMYRECSAMHDLYRDWVAALMDYVYKEQGEESLYQALRQTIGGTFAWTPETDELDFRLKVRILASALRGHLEPMTIVEDDEKVCIRMEPCGSGQRLVQSGAYGPPRNLTMMQQPHAMTWGMTDFPVYCTHAPVQEILSIERLGHPAYVAFPPDKVARRESCWYCVYKDPRDIPEEMYRRVGKEKPEE